MPTPTKYIRGSCKCCCELGAIVPRWQNVTQVETSVNVPPCSAPATQSANGTSIPAPRMDITYDGATDGGMCTGTDAYSCGLCGGWLVNGDLNGLSAQEVTDAVSDILTCASPDSTHATSDHNCYQKQGGNVDMRTSKLYGGQWILARKYWHGCLGWASNDAPGCPNSVNVAPDQVRYCNVDYEIALSYNDPLSSLSSSSSSTGGYQVNSKTGIVTSNLVTTQDRYQSGTHSYHSVGGVGFADSGSGPVPFASGGTTDVDSKITNYYCGDYPQFPGYAGSFLDFIADWNSGAPWYAPPNGAYTIWPAVSDPNNYSATGHGSNYDTGSGNTSYEDSSITFSRSGNVCSWSMTDHVTSYTSTDVLIQDVTQTSTGTVTLSAPYTSTDCYADFVNSMSAWDMSDMKLAKLRTDEQLANGPLIVYDETGPTSPLMGFVAATMNDYTAAQNMDGSWPQRAWADPNNYQYTAPGGSIRAENIPGTGGCTFHTPMRTGAIISHNQAGSDRHFWFGFNEFDRESCAPLASGYQWSLESHGGYSDTTLPAVTMRWLDRLSAQYDANGFCEGVAGTPAPGNYPQAWWTQYGTILTGGKYVQAAQKWNSINKGRPCGPDKYAVDQTTVGCVTGAGAGYFTVTKPPSTITAFQGSGYVIVTGSFGTPGVYPVTSVTGTGPWTINVGAILDGIPTGWTHTTAGDYLGYLRFPTAPGICGRVPITTTYSNPTLTINTASQPYLRIRTTGSISVDIYDTTMTLLASAVALTRVNDGQFTATAGAKPTAAYMVAHGVDWTLFQNQPRHTRSAFGLAVQFASGPDRLHRGRGGHLCRDSGLHRLHGNAVQL